MTPETVLTSKLAEDIVWRIRELSEIVRSCADAPTARSDALSRAAVPIIYAHWEGYFVFSTNAYLNFVSEKRIRLSGLRDEFWNLTIRKKYRPQQINTETNFNNFLTEIKKFPDQSFKKGKFERISGNSNLKSDVLIFCCRSLGFQTDPFEAYYDFIDDELLKKRNFIAHGESLRFDKDSIPEYRDKVVDLMRITQTQIENSVATGAYAKTP